MALLGDASWYLPRWLDRALPDLDAHGAGLVVEPPVQREPERALASAG